MGEFTIIEFLEVLRLTTESFSSRRGPKMAAPNHLLVIGRVKTRLFFLRGQFSFALLNRGAQILARIIKNFLE